MTTLSLPRLALGQSLAIDLHYCELSRIAQRDVVEEVMLHAARESGAGVVDSHFHEFSPQGISGVVVITESHFAIHTWPEHRFAAVDVFTCGSKVDLQRATEVLKEGFKALSANVTHHLERGAIKPPPPTDQLTVMITVQGCRNTSDQAASRFLGAVVDLIKAPNSAPHFANRSFSLLTEQINLTGRFSAERLDVIAMGALSLAPPALAAAAMRAFDGATFSFHTAPYL